MVSCKPKLLIAFSGLAALISCANPYRANFNSTWDRHPQWIESRLAPRSTEPKMRIVSDIQDEGWRLFERGYIMIGYSKFDGPKINIDLALTQARKAGADIVLAERKYAKTLTETTALTHWPPSETTDIRETTSRSDARGSRIVNRDIEITTSRGPETIYVPKQVEYYEYSATYWRKVARPIFGALVQDLPEELRQNLQTNRGLVVSAVMMDSPAFHADLLKNDVILKINGDPVPSAALYYENLTTLAGKTVELTVKRGTQTFQRTLKLNE